MPLGTWGEARLGLLRGKVRYLAAGFADSGRRAAYLYLGSPDRARSPETIA